MVGEQVSLFPEDEENPVSLLAENLAQSLETDKLIHKSLLETLNICNELECAIYPALAAEGAAKRDPTTGKWTITNITLGHLTELSRIVQKLATTKTTISANLRDGVVVQGAIEQTIRQQQQTS